MKVDEWTILPEISLFHSSDVLTSQEQISARHRVRRQIDASKQGARIGARHQVQQEAQTGARHRMRR